MDFRNNTTPMFVPVLLSSYEKNNSKRKKYTEAEKNLVKELTEKNVSLEDIGLAINRPVDSIRKIQKDFRLENNTYNKKHVADKYFRNYVFIDYIKPKSVLDLYCGPVSFYKNKTNIPEVVTNDKDEKIPADYHDDALRTAAYLYSQHKTYDIVDLDPYTSPYECIDLAIQLAKKGLVISFGELSAKRWGKLPPVYKLKYGIETKEELSLAMLVDYVRDRGKIYGKLLEPFYSRTWHGNFSRVWFKVESISSIRQKEFYRKAKERKLAAKQ